MGPPRHVFRTCNFDRWEDRQLQDRPETCGRVVPPIVRLDIHGDLAKPTYDFQSREEWVDRCLSSTDALPISSGTTKAYIPSSKTFMHCTFGRSLTTMAMIGAQD